MRNGCGGPALVDALDRARERSVLVRLILESTADTARALTHDGAAAFTSLREDVEIYVWPLEKRPAGSRLHAKVAVADGELAFVTSAIFTGHALDENLEVGLLVTGGNLPRPSASRRLLKRWPRASRGLTPSLVLRNSG